jgi:hypothetical protein
MLKAKLLGATAAAEVLAIEDVFSTYLYSGNGSTQTITNGIDLAGEGGLVWVKNRTGAFDQAHWLFDTVRGAGQGIRANTSGANVDAQSDFNQAFLSSGFSFSGNDAVNGSGYTYASWTFRKAERFFDVVTYTGTGSNRTIAHNLGVVPGCIIVKRTDTAADWQVYHRGNTVAPETDYLVLNSTDATVDDNTRWNDTLPTSTVFSLGTATTVNASSGTYVAYVYAHDPLGPSGDGSDGLIACGSYTGNGSNTGPVVSLGWEPQWVMIKASSKAGDNWRMFDTMRGMDVNTTGSGDGIFSANTTAAEAFTNRLSPTATGFQLTDTAGDVNTSGATYIYIAIRRGPMREPTSGTEVFGIDTWGGGPPAFTSGFPVDWALMKTIAGGESAVFTRMLGPTKLRANLTDAEVAESDGKFDYMNGWHPSSITLSNLYSWMFRRAPGFFDVVAYTGTGANRTVSHNLGAAPELMIVKKRSAADNWVVYAGDATDYLILNSTAATADLDTMWNDTAPTSSVFSLGTNDDVNGNTATFIAYLFASLPGISKVGSYTGNGSSQTINCGFTTGARFILIKRTDNTGDWYVWDTARGIVTGNDPHLSLNTTAAEVTTNDTIDPDSTGFIVNQVAATNVNVNTATYIFLAIA